jgi:hypothetical protein
MSTSLVILGSVVDMDDESSLSGTRLVALPEPSCSFQCSNSLKPELESRLCCRFGTAPSAEDSAGGCGRESSASS